MVVYTYTRTATRRGGSGGTRRSPCRATAPSKVGLRLLKKTLKKVVYTYMSGRIWWYIRTHARIYTCTRTATRRGASGGTRPSPCRATAPSKVPLKPETGYETGYGYCLPPYGTAYRSALRTTRTRNTYPNEEVRGQLATRNQKPPLRSQPQTLSEAETRNPKAYTMSRWVVLQQGSTAYTKLV
jgi:hypothetical protein